ncbi:hypothetical protein CDD81_161 [Ophiocordyceps australis]|uniref:Uncharacterized protein n=1 Tax=Ophiocordyceps australis TaxID=1399860 RepID=A0A2C5YKD9_9HYPO|nr:hypothetical protein CDD81_161 [Ophiocordyceps australis]
MVANTRERIKRIHDLELSHGNNKRKTDGICRDEEARLAKLEILALRDEIEHLKDQIIDKEAGNSDLCTSIIELRVQLEGSKGVVRAQETRTKKKDMEIDNLKAEINALNETLQDSGKAIQEKFALLREVNRLRPEMEHLQSQLTNYQAMVAEKNELRRQLDSLEVELENEKRSRQRLQAKADDAAMSDLRAQVEEAEKRLAADKKEREKARREHERELGEIQAANERLQERIETLKDKYKTTQSQAKETRAQLEKCQADLQKATKSALRNPGKEAAKKSVTIEPGLQRKRRAQEMSYEDITVQTPGAGEGLSTKAIGKRRGLEQAALGEKSTFSITPFLNRTRNLEDDSAQEPGNDTFQAADAGGDEGQGQEPSEALEAQTSDQEALEHEGAAQKEQDGIAAAKQPRGRPKKVLGDSSSTQANKCPGKKTSRAKQAAEASSARHQAKQVPVDEQENAILASKSHEAPSTEEHEVDEAEQEVQQTNKAFLNKNALLQPKMAAPGGDVKRKKRKLLGAASKQSLCAVDEEAQARPPAGAGAAAAADVQVKKPVVGTKRGKLLGKGVRNAFAGTAFSPLKRDRRGMNASFLA